MNQKSIEELLSEMSYLWTSGEWSLHCSYHSRTRVIFIFPEGRPSPVELLAVRALIPRFADSSMSLLKAEVGAVAEFVVGEFGTIEAQRLLSAAHTHGLQTRTEDVSSTRCIPVNVHGSALIIEDNTLASLAAEEMRRRGIPIVSHKAID